jgi:hypothetical protein
MNWSLDLDMMSTTDFRSPPDKAPNCRIGIWGDGFGTVFGGLRQFRVLSSGLWKPVVRHHAQI